MNYFAHLHLAHQSNTSLTGNLLGDFIKGSNLSHLPKELELGVRLHRKIDSFTDAHPINQEFRAQNTEIRRFAGVGLDILFDHLLALKLGAQYELLCNHFYQVLNKEMSILQTHLPNSYQSKVTAITTQDWFAGYGNIEGITFALTRTSQRFKRPVDLTQICEWYLANQHHVEQAFALLYQDTLTFTEQQKRTLSDQIGLV